ncbi:hypothetical protein L7F22_005791 [Adiantum nelumboides]|nr:hypothetical protein [Adiantum nelumboides]
MDATWQMRFDISNFEHWKVSMHDALTLLGQVLPLQGMDSRPESMIDDEWEDLDELARFTIMLHPGESVYSIFLDACIARDTWERLCDAYGTDTSREIATFSERYRLLQDNVDDDSSKLIVNHLIQGVRDEPKLHSSYAEAWGVDLSIASHPNEATVKYTEFLLATASSEEREKEERTSVDRQRLAAFTVGALTPCMRLYAFLGQEIKEFLGEDSPETPYHQWIDTYSSKDFQCDRFMLSTGQCLCTSSLE